MLEYDAPETHDHVLLACDSAIGSSVALCVGGRIFETSSDDARAHAEVMGALIAEVIETAGADPRAVTGVVTGIGPGPFTGLRVGIAAAQGFALGASAPLMPVHSHEAAALEYLEATGEPTVRIVQDAKRRELFVTDYAGLDEAGIPVRTKGPRIEPRATYTSIEGEVWPERIPAGRLLQLAVRKLGAENVFEPLAALYLRQPDVAAPGPAKRVST